MGSLRDQVRILAGSAVNISHEKVGTMPSIVGTWNIRVTWSFGLGAGTELNAPDFTFNADGTWTDRGNHRGRWLQVGDQVVWNVTESAGLVYSANIQPGHVLPHEASMKGIMGWLTGGNQGSFHALRLFVPDEVVVANGGVPESNTDPLLGPVADPLLDDSSSA